MKKLLPAALFLALTAPAQAADEWALQTSLTSIHPGAHREYNERNFGLGLRRDFAGQGRTINYLAGGTLKNSMSDTTMYAGGGQRLRFRSWDGHLDIGYFAGLITYPSHSPDPIPALLPLVEIGSGAIGLTALYIPRVKSDGDHAVLFQLQFRLGARP